LILAFDTYYYEDKAKTVCIRFEGWDAIIPVNIYSEMLTGIEDYILGEFFRRELPCIVSLLEKIPLNDVEAIVIDGFVFLDDSGKAGLGAQLYNFLNSSIPIIGVAKSNFKTIERLKNILLRGLSDKPLHITSVGIDTDLATEKIKSMNGQYRIPTLLKLLDRLTKES
jgi:deoxyribonuclease V